MKNKMTKDTVPSGFSIGMVVSDMLPVIFFGAASFVIGLIFNNLWINVGAVLTFVSGILKVIWKLIVVIKNKNVWPLFMQMRIAMPVGFFMFLVCLIISLTKMPNGVAAAAITGMPQFIFFVISVLGMITMIYFARKLDSSDARSNWIEQTTNGLAQASFFIGIMIIYLNK